MKTDDAVAVVIGIVRLCGNAVARERNIFPALENHALRVVVENSEHGKTVFEQRERDGAERNPARKIIRAVDGIEHPREAGTQRARRLAERRQIFFRAKIVLRERRREKFADAFRNGEIRRRHARVIALPMTFDFGKIFFEKRNDGLHDLACRFDALGGFHRNFPQSAKTSRQSATAPVTAAAATMSGDISKVRPVGEPWRPLKLRFDVLAQT